MYNDANAHSDFTEAYTAREYIPVVGRVGTRRFLLSDILGATQCGLAAGRSSN